MNSLQEELCLEGIAAIFKATGAICALVYDEAASPAEIVKYLDGLAPRINRTSQVFKMIVKSMVASNGGQGRIGPKRESLPESDRAAGWDAGDLVVNARYDVEHKYKDDFQMQVWDADGPWIYGMLISGNLKDWRRVGIALGDRIAVRRCYCTFTLAVGAEAPAIEDGEVS